MEQDKRLSYCINRDIIDTPNGRIYEYTYKFRCGLHIENMEDVKDDEFKQNIINGLVSEFRINLNSVVFGDPCPIDKEFRETPIGEYYVERKKTPWWSNLISKSLNLTKNLC